jgi:hypothetical protein
LFSRNVLKVDALDDESTSEILHRLEQRGFADATLAAEMINKFKAGELTGQELTDELQEMLAEQGLDGSNAAVELLSLVEQQTLANAGISQELLAQLELEGFEHTGEFLGQIMVAIESLPNDIALIGHTDATPYRSDNGYSNWELSTDRANSSRRALIDAGLSESRIVRVVGMAAQEPLNVEDPFSAEKRRISVLILRENHKPADAITIQ